VNDILKQRLVGALILVALGVVFWPIIFVAPEGENKAELRSIPPPPGVSMALIEAPDEVGLRASPQLTAIDDSPVVEVPLDGVQDEAGEGIPVPSPAQTEPAAPVPPPSAISDTRETRTEAPEPLAMDSDGVPVAWTLQVATLSSDEKADALRKQLLDMHHKAYVTKIRRNGKTLHRVCIGPKFERIQLESLQANIDAKFGVNSLVARYMP
jgi:DedD protein